MSGPIGKFDIYPFKIKFTKVRSSCHYSHSKNSYPANRLGYCRPSLHKISSSTSQTLLVHSIKFDPLTLYHLRVWPGLGVSALPTKEGKGSSTPD